MGLETEIGWCDGTWNPWRGCSKISPGCRNCYAATFSVQNPKVLGTWGAEGAGGVRVVGAEPSWADPLTAQKRAEKAGRRYKMFLGSFMDFFDEWEGPMTAHTGRVLNVLPSGRWAVLDEKKGDGTLLTMDMVRQRALAIISRCPLVDFLILTKRADLILPTLERVGRMRAADGSASVGSDVAGAWADGHYPKNVWLGVSVENQQQLWLRAERLRDMPARLRWISAEPLLGPLDFRPWFGRGETFLNPTGGRPTPEPLRSDPFDWVVVGGESGYDARECDVEAVRDVLRQCREFGLPIFVKQLGAKPVVTKPDLARFPLRLAHKKGEDLNEWPLDLQHQEYPDLEEGDMGL